MTKKHSPVSTSKPSKKTDNSRRKVGEKTKAWQPVIDQTTKPPKGSGGKPKK